MGKLEDKGGRQRIWVFQQNGSGRSKVDGIVRFGKDRFSLKLFDIDTPLPPVIDDSADLLPETIDADFVLDFLKHPDLSHDLAVNCAKQKIPIVASGKKTRPQGAVTPYT